MSIFQGLNLNASEMLLAIFGAAFLSFLILNLGEAWRSKNLPPGPKRKPLIGNLLDMPSEKEWLTLSEWGRQYGDICSLTVFGQNLIVVNSAEIASNMFGSKAAIYSDRPQLVMFGDLCGYKRFLSFAPYGSLWRRQRTLLQKTIGTAASMKQFSGIEETEGHRLLKRTLKDPDNILNHIRMAAGSIILRISYGYETTDGHDPLVDLAETVMDGFADTMRPGAYLVDSLPILKFVPRWFPGARFQRHACDLKKALHRFVETPYNLVKSRMAAGTNETSFTSSLIEQSNLNPQEEHDIKWSSAMLFAGGADTTVSSLYAFILALCLYPDVQTKAQAELDEVVGRDRLPTTKDRSSLPYVDAVVTELFRWHSVAPMNVRRVMEDDVQNGYHIPKNATIMINQWQITHDPKVYPNPMHFDPTRFLPSKHQAAPPDPRLYCFGTGKRICPGRYLADASVFITAAMILSVFRIDKKIKDGKVITPAFNPMTGATSHVEPFECSIKPRDSMAEDLITSSYVGVGFHEH